MFAIAPLHPLHNAMIEIVSITPGISVADLRKELISRHKIRVSLQHVYRIVHQMIDEQILVKIGGSISLNFMWLSYVSFFCDRAKSVKHEHAFRSSVSAMKEGQKLRYPALSMLEVETIWNHLLAQLRQIQPDEKNLYKFYSHAWWQLGKNSGKESSFYQKIAASGVACHWVFGSGSRLDREATEWLSDIFPYRIGQKTGFPNEGYNLNVFGDYIVECIIPKTISKQFASFFEHTKSLEDFDSEFFLDLFTRTGKYEVTVWKNAKQAAVLRSPFTKLFSTVVQ